MSRRDTKQRDYALNIRDVYELTTISPAAWYRLIQKEGAPPPIKLGRKAIWMYSTVIKYLKDKEKEQGMNHEEDRKSEERI